MNHHRVFPAKWRRRGGLDYILKRERWGWAYIVAATDGGVFVNVIGQSDGQNGGENTLKQIDWKFLELFQLD